MRTAAFLAVLLGMVGNGTPLAAQEHLVIKGTVSDSATHEPIPGVNVTVRGKNIGTSTDSSGHYVLSIPKGAYIIAFSHIAYRKLLRTVAPGRPSTHILFHKCTSPVRTVPACLYYYDYYKP